MTPEFADLLQAVAALNNPLELRKLISAAAERRVALDRAESERFRDNLLKAVAIRVQMMTERDGKRSVQAEWTPPLADLLARHVWALSCAPLSNITEVVIQVEARPPLAPFTDERWFAICQAMQRLGGGFVQALGSAGLRADHENRARIAAAWPEIVAQYAKLTDSAPEAT